MIPKPNQHITIFFRTGISISGDVISWSDQVSVISSDKSTIVIQNTKDDIMFFKLSQSKYIATTEYIAATIPPIKSKDDIKKIADLKIELNNIEREELSAKLKTHTTDGMKVVQYGIPNDIKVASTIKYSAKETPRKDFGIGAELSNLFNKKDSCD